jgi:CheY-like chemotaxis protein
VEDDRATRELYRHVLVARGYHVTAVGDGIDALRYLEVAHPDVVVLDLMLPTLSGHDVRQELRANPATSQIPVVIVTGADLPSPSRDSEQVLRKPIAPEDLATAVARAGRWRTRTEQA